MYSTRSNDDEAVRRARGVASELPESVLRRLTAFRDSPPPAGCMLLKGLPVGELPPTPPTPTTPTAKSDGTETIVLACASELGEPVGYLPEHGGDLVQNIVPVRSSASSQTSTSSTVDLMFHT